MTNHSTINPFYRAGPIPAFAQEHPSRTMPTYAKLPAAPRNASPVPHLTSLYHFDGAGEYGSRSYPSNCGGNLIKDLIQFFQPSTVFDPMSGSGTCSDVRQELAIPCTAFDLKGGFDATDPTAYSRFAAGRGFDLIWAHPPYWRQKIHSDHPNDLSQASSLEQFLDSYERFITECSRRLSPKGKFAILMGDYTRLGGRVRFFDPSHQANCFQCRVTASLHRHHSL